MNIEKVTKQYNVYISDSYRNGIGSGVLFYPGGEFLLVVTCAHVIENRDSVLVTLLKPKNIMADEYDEKVMPVSKNRFYFFPRDVASGAEGLVEPPEDIALLMIPKPDDFEIEPTRFCIGETASDMPIIIQGYPNGVPTDALLVENLETLKGTIFVSVSGRKRFKARITDQTLDRSNLVDELRGISGGPIWKSDRVNNEPICLLGIISATCGPAGHISKFWAEKAEIIGQFLKIIFDISIEKRLVDIPSEDVASDDLPPAAVFCSELTTILQSDNDKWIEERRSTCKLNLNELQLQKAIDVAKEAIDNPRFEICCMVSQKQLMQTLLYCYEIGDLTAEFEALEEDMRSRRFVRDYDRRRHMTYSFMQRNYAETIKVAESCIRECQEDMGLSFTARVFQCLARAFLYDLTEEETIRTILDSRDNIILDVDDKVLVNQLIGLVYSEKYADYKKAVRFLNRAVQISSDNIILESLGSAYFRLATAGATREDGGFDPNRIDRNALYKAREIFLKVRQKADDLFWAGTMRRYGLQIYHTFLLYDDCYRVMAFYPDVVKYVKPPKDVDENKFWREIELGHVRNEILTGKIIVHQHLTQDDINHLILEAELTHCVQLLETAMIQRTYGSIKLSDYESEARRAIALFEEGKQSVPQELILPLCVQMMTIYRYGILLFGWDKADKLMDCAEQIRTRNPSLEKMVLDCLYEFEAPLNEVIRQATDEFEHNRDIGSWNRLTQLYTRHAMLEKADEMYRMLFAEYPDLIMDEPEYFFRSYIDYITSYHRDLLDALQCFLDKEQLFHDLDVRNYIELELMSCSRCYNTPERFEVEPRPFVQKGVLTEEQYHRKAFIASLVNLKLEEAQEHFDILRRYPHHVNPKTGNIIVPHQEEIHYLSLIGKIRPHNLYMPNALEKVVPGVDSRYDTESWHVPISDSLKNRFSIESKIAIDACGLYYLFQAHGQEFLKRFETIFIPHLVIIHFLEDLSRTDDSVIRSILQFIPDNKFILLQSPGFRTQVNIRKTIPYDESASVIALGMENGCLAVLGEPMLSHDLIDKYRRSFIRPNEIISLF